MEHNIITARFPPGGRTAVISGTLWQYDWGQILRIEVLELPSAYEVQFSNVPYCGRTLPAIGSVEGVEIPNALLKAGAFVYAFLFLSDATSGETEYRITLPVVPRPCPPEDDVTPEQQTAIEQAISALNENAGRAETAAGAAETSAEDAGDAATLAESWAVGGTGTRPGEDTDNSKFWALVAQMGAQESGYAIFDVDTEDGHMYVTITTPLDEDVDFRVNESTGHLEVTIHG